MNRYIAGVIVTICTIFVIGGLMYSDHQEHLKEQEYLASTGETVILTARTNLYLKGYALNGSVRWHKQLRVEYITDEDTISVGNIIAFYDETKTAQIGMVVDIVDDTTFSVFLNDYNDTDKARPVAAEDIYGIAKGHIPVLPRPSSGGSSGFVSGYMIGKMFK